MVSHHPVEQKLVRIGLVGGFHVSTHEKYAHRQIGFIFPNFRGEFQKLGWKPPSGSYPPSFWDEHLTTSTKPPGNLVLRQTPPSVALEWPRMQRCSKPHKVPSRSLTASFPLKRYRNPIGKANVFQPPCFRDELLDFGCVTLNPWCLFRNPSESEVIKLNTSIPCHPFFVVVLIFGWF